MEGRRRKVTLINHPTSTLSLNSKSDGSNNTTNLFPLQCTPNISLQQTQLLLPFLIETTPSSITPMILKFMCRRIDVTFTDSRCKSDATTGTKDEGADLNGKARKSKKKIWGKKKKWSRTQDK
ncbi:hypothetical protein RJT34_20404 [Clitoria ternatea]|uniref:Uncharacterized protein n=1 Tax=Clitoria ternatea TaxID=43366 RepID=A0AAN9ISS0_CLITE